MALGLFAGEYPDISVKELQSAIKKGKVAVIDVNGAKSFARGHIPTAIDFSSNGKELAKLLPKDKIHSLYLIAEVLDAELTREALMQPLSLDIRMLSICPQEFPDGRKPVLAQQRNNS